MSPQTGELARVASTFVQEWLDAWNDHDLEKIMVHYSSNVVFTSPLIAQLGASASGTLEGSDDLRRYFAEGLERFPDLRFEPLGTMVGVTSITIVYRNQTDTVTAEVMTLRDGVVTHGTAHYGHMEVR